jgi:hypothetical protein
MGEKKPISGGWWSFCDEGVQEVGCGDEGRLEVMIVTMYFPHPAAG